MNSNLDKILTQLTWWFVPAIIGLSVPLLIVLFWWLAGGTLGAKPLQAIGLLIDAAGFFLIAYTLLVGRREYEKGRNPSNARIKWRERFEYIDEYSRADVALGKLGVGLVLSGFFYQFIGVLQT